MKTLVLETTCWMEVLKGCPGSHGGWGRQLATQPGSVFPLSWSSGIPHTMPLTGGRRQDSGPETYVWEETAGCLEEAGDESAREKRRCRWHPLGPLTSVHPPCRVSRASAYLCPKEVFPEAIPPKRCHPELSRAPQPPSSRHWPGLSNWLHLSKTRCQKLRWFLVHRRTSLWDTEGMKFQGTKLGFQPNLGPYHTGP